MLGSSLARTPELMHSPLANDDDDDAFQCSEMSHISMAQIQKRLTVVYIEAKQSEWGLGYQENQIRL